MRIALFGGSFDPIHREHIRLAEAAKTALGLDKLIFIPSYRAPHKALGAVADGEDRLALCKIACEGLPFAEADGFELDRAETSYTYLTCRAFREKYPSATLYFLVGADMLEDFFTWKCPEEILNLVTLVACGRGEALDESLVTRSRETFHRDIVILPFTGDELSSTDARVALAFSDMGRAKSLLGDEVLAEIVRRGIYRYPQAEGGLDLLTPERRAHSERVARMAVGRARSLKIPERKVMLAAMLHDCGKYIPLDSPYLVGFAPPEGVPAPVMHQFVGAYIARTMFGIEDEDILNAIRYHTSGRAGMSELEKLIFLADMLEEGRSYEGVELLRALFEEDLDGCLFASLFHQLMFLKEKNAPIYPMTEEAFEWIKSQHMSRFIAKIKD